MNKKDAVLSNALRPRPDILVTCRDNEGNDNILAVTCACNAGYLPPMVMVGIIPTHHSYKMIKESGVFTINLVTEAMREAYGICGSKSGREVDKFELSGLTKMECTTINAPYIKESPVSIECKVTGSIMTGSHEMFAATIEAVHADEDIVNDKGNIDFTKVDFLTYKILP